MFSALPAPLISALVAFLISMIAGPFTIQYLRRLKFGQNVRTDGPQSHLKKSGTPTMGGILILFTITVVVVVTGNVNDHLALALFATLGFGAIGLIDDMLKVVAKRSLGLRARDKIIGQLLISLLIALYAMTSPEIGAGLIVPFSSSEIVLPAYLYIPFVIFVLMGATNGANLTDGVDGLAAGATAVSAAAYAIIASSFGFPQMAEFAGAIAGACLGFSWFNAHPAQVFMGDTGSLGLGAAIGVLAVFTRTPLLLPLIGVIFVIEALSVIVQVLYFKLTKGRRVFRMTPLHHHFELTGWSEPKVTIRFWLIALFFAALGLLAVL